MPTHGAARSRHDGAGGQDAPNEVNGRRRALLAAACGLGFTPIAALARAAFAEAGPPRLDPTNVDSFLSGINLCKLTPQAIAGPYYIDNALVRADIRDGEAGVSVRLRLEVADAFICAPLAGAVVSVWHCNALGRYSGHLEMDPGQLPPRDLGYRRPSGPERFLRGVQVTDGAGAVEFLTVFPGWYAPRTPHIHVKVFLNQRQLITTQLYFPQALINALALESPYSTRGPGMYTNENDIIIRQSHGAQGAFLQTAQGEDGILVAATRIGVADS
jgi:protocatechuate 3,4-dioxygenase beta subunit